MDTIEIKLNDTAFSTVFVRSFDNEKAFIEATLEGHYLDRDLKTRKALLSQVYRIAVPQKVRKNDNIGITE
jgi:hypothetical protein